MRCSYKAYSGFKDGEPNPFPERQCSKEMDHEGGHAVKYAAMPWESPGDKWVHFAAEWYDAGGMLFDEPGLDSDVDLVYHESWSQFGTQYKPDGYN